MCVIKGFFFREQRGQDAKPTTTHCHLVVRLRVREAHSSICLRSTNRILYLHLILNCYMHAILLYRIMTYYGTNQYPVFAVMPNV
jgi:hypothetical protein